jgi:hypothetical protein
VAAGKKSGEHAFDHVVLPDDELAHFIGDAREGGAETFGLLCCVSHGFVSVEMRAGSD